MFPVLPFLSLLLLVQHTSSSSHVLIVSPYPTPLSLALSLASSAPTTATLIVPCNSTDLVDPAPLTLVGLVPVKSGWPSPSNPNINAYCVPYLPTTAPPCPHTAVGLGMVGCEIALQSVYIDAVNKVHPLVVQYLQNELPAKLETFPKLVLVPPGFPPLPHRASGAPEENQYRVATYDPSPLSTEHLLRSAPSIHVENSIASPATVNVPLYERERSQRERRERGGEGAKQGKRGKRQAGDCPWAADCERSERERRERSSEAEEAAGWRLQNSKREIVRERPSTCAAAHMAEHMSGRAHERPST
jgi:hypothetical protein